ncbi:MAG: flagellar hook-length control protein FliK [bacterium]
MELFRIATTNGLSWQTKKSEGKEEEETADIFSLLLSALVAEAPDELPFPLISNNSYPVAESKRKNGINLEELKVEVLAGQILQDIKESVEIPKTAEIIEPAPKQQEHCLVITEQMPEPISFFTEALLNLKLERQVNTARENSENGSTFDVQLPETQETPLPKEEMIKENGETIKNMPKHTLEPVYLPLANSTGDELLQPSDTISNFVRINREPELTLTNITEELIAKVQFVRFGGETQLEIQLKPEILGKLKVELHHQEGKLSARFITGNIQVKELLATELPALRESLLHQNMQQTPMEVDIFLDYQESGDTSGQANDFHQWQRQLPNGQITGDAEQELLLAVEPIGKGVINYLV